MPDGSPGEIYIGGTGLARGYLGLPAMTADRFLPDPFGGDGGRLYRSGDLARRHPDGAVEILGRTDHQVKIRGHRIELGEIETVATALPEVRLSVAHPVPDASGAMRLVLYVVPEEGCSPTPAGLRAALAETLPEFMVPSGYELMDAFPLTPNGKVDRRALPAPAAPAAPARGAEPSTPSERTLAGIWAELLGVAEPSADDDFLSSGGHSLMAAALMARLRDLLGVTVPAGELLRCRTLRDQAALVDRLSVGGGRPAAPLVRARRGGDLPLSSAQRRIWFVENARTDGASYTTVTAQRLRGELDVAALTEAVAAVAGRHEILRTCFPAPGGRPAQRVRDDLTIPVRVWDAPEGPDADAAIRRRIDEETREPFDLEIGPLVRILVVRTAPAEQLVVFNWHHIVVDGWSLGIFWRELAEAYRAVLAGEKPRWEPLTLQYADVAAQEHEQPQDHAAQLAYWRDRLDGAPPLTALPSDRPRSAARSSRGAQERATIPADVVERFGRMCAERGVTLYTGLLAVFALLLARHGGEDDVVVGSPVAGRSRTEYERLIGFFANTIVLRLDAGGDPTVAGLLERARDTVFGALAHQDVPFEQVVEALAPGRRLGHNPLFQVMFTMEGAETGRLELPGLDAEPAEVNVDEALFDVTFYVRTAPSGALRVEAEYSTDLFEPARPDASYGTMPGSWRPPWRRAPTRGSATWSCRPAATASASRGGTTRTRRERPVPVPHPVSPGGSTRPAVPFRARGCTCSTRRGGSCPSASPARCSSAGTRCPRPPSSWPTRSPRRPAPAWSAPATPAAGSTPVSWSTAGASENAPAPRRRTPRRPGRRRVRGASYARRAEHRRDLVRGPRRPDGSARTTTSSSWAATPCWPRWSCRGCARGSRSRSPCRSCSPPRTSRGSPS